MSKLWDYWIVQLGKGFQEIQENEKTYNPILLMFEK
ncbi:MAG: hypothetical protein CM15mP28_3910 [Pseudomonadota bacterium]|nr:MAG: hypothetical protein CM15mP28_3910 [Pseudomonadota bacterium]